MSSSTSHPIARFALALVALLAGAVSGWTWGEQPARHSGDPTAADLSQPPVLPALPAPAPFATALAPAWQEAQLPPDSSADRPRQLQALAEDGNAYAAYELATLLRDCPSASKLSDEQIDVIATRGAAMNAEQTDRQRALLEQELGLDLAAPALDAVAIAEQRITELRAKRDACQGLDDAQEHDAWLHAMERAALLGHPQAQLDYVRTALSWSGDVGEIARRKPLLQSFMSAALQRGEADALLAWSTAQKDGYFGEPDHVLGYAYMQAWTRHPSHPLYQRMLLASMGFRPPMARELSPAELRQADALAEQILARCCAGG